MSVSIGGGMSEQAGTDVMAGTGGAKESSRPTGREVIDLHVHSVGVGDSCKECWASKEFRSGPTFAAMLVSLGTSTHEAGDARLREAILDAVDSSMEADRSVVLAMDGVHKNGRFVDSESHLVVSNDYVLGMARQSRRVLLGASVHPYRLSGQMLAETDRCIGEGAALFVWAPAGQQINPEDERCIPFYVRLAREGVPLLCHGGTEFAVHPSDFRIGRYNDPRRLTGALDIGVKVIVANCAPQLPGAGIPSDEGYFEALIGMLKEAEAKRWELFADISSCCSPSRMQYLGRIVQEIAAGNISPRRFLYGSDFPMPAVDINLFKDALSPYEMMTHIRGQGNLLDSHVRIVKQFGMHDSVFTNACDVLRL